MPKGSWREFDKPSTLRSKEVKSLLDKSQLNVRVQRTRGGKAGKTVTVITGLCLDSVDAKSLLKILKAHCGTGGTVKDDLFELQGDQVVVVMKLLQADGYSPKQSGG